MEKPIQNSNEFDPNIWRGPVTHTETGEVFDSHIYPYKLNDMLSLAGIYEHYKSTPKEPKYYLVSSVIENTETGECFAIYEALYGTGEICVLARPMEMFTEKVEVNGQTIPRFRFVANGMDAD